MFEGRCRQSFFKESWIIVRLRYKNSKSLSRLIPYIWFTLFFYHSACISFRTRTNNFDFEFDSKHNTSEEQDIFEEHHIYQSAAELSVYGALVCLIISTAGLSVYGPHVYRQSCHEIRRGCQTLIPGYIIHSIFIPYHSSLDTRLSTSTA